MPTSGERTELVDDTARADTLATGGLAGFATAGTTLRTLRYRPTRPRSTCSHRLHVILARTESACAALTKVPSHSNGRICICGHMTGKLDGQMPGA